MAFSDETPIHQDSGILICWMESGDKPQNALPPADLVGFRPAPAAVLFAESFFRALPLFGIFNESTCREQTPPLRRHVVIESRSPCYSRVLFRCFPSDSSEHESEGITKQNGQPTSRVDWPFSRAPMPREIVTPRYSGNSAAGRSCRRWRCCYWTEAFRPRRCSS